MSNYRRLISYIYAYEGKKKGKNIGFVKLEARDGQCKLNANVKKVYVEGNDVGVYLLGKEGQETFLSNIFIRSGSGEFRTVLDATNVMGTGNSLDTYYGLTIHDVKNPWRSYTTIWEDSVAHMAQEELPGTADKSVSAGQAVSNVVKEIESEIAREESRKAEEEQIRTKAADVGISAAAEVLDSEQIPEITLYSDQKSSDPLRAGRGIGGRPLEGGMVRQEAARAGLLQEPGRSETEAVKSEQEPVIVDFSRKKQNQQRPGAQAGTHSGIVQERKPDGQPGPQPGPKPGTQPGPKPGPQPGPKPGPQPCPKPGLYPGPNPGPQPGPKPGPKPGPQPGPKPGPQPGPKPGPYPGPNPRPQPGPKPGPQPGPKPGPYPGPNPGPQPGPKPGPRPGIFPPFFLSHSAAPQQEEKMEKNQVRESGQTQESGTSDPTTGIISEGVRPPELHQDIIPPEGFRISEGTEGIAGAGVRSAASAAEAFLTGVQRQLRTGRQTQPVPDRQTQADQQMQPVPDRQTQIDQQMQPVSDRQTQIDQQMQPVSDRQTQTNQQMRPAPDRQTRADRQEWTDQPVVEAPDAKQTDQVYQMQPEDQQYQTQTPDTLVSPELENPEVLKYLQETEELTQNPEKLWEVLMKSYPKIQPFDYDEGCDILTIRPQDIGRLPREVWVYGNNSFLLHGYYNFRYLILVRLGNSKGKPRYLLGIPGHYYSNEKYMASMFGFPNFVLSKKQPSNDGRFGYWYTDIRMG